MSIQYFGRGLDDTETDRYMPHCDGQCDGLKFQNAGRVATMVMYCETPLKGGANNFRNAGIMLCLRLEWQPSSAIWARMATQMINQRNIHVALSWRVIRRCSAVVAAGCRREEQCENRIRGGVFF
jgi:hypothetical protein